MELKKPRTGNLVTKKCTVCLAQIETDEMRCPEDGALLYPMKHDKLSGQTLANSYEIQEKIGEGGYGRVYRAKHTRLHKTVAVKILHAEYVDQPDLVKRFEREAKAVSALSHPGIANVFDFGILDDGQPFFVMDFVDGISLEDIIKTGGALSWQAALPIFCGAATALGYAHKHSILHRDIKPSNLLVDQKEQSVKLLDFGLAQVEDANRLTKTGDVAGTPHYMSPEQCVGEKLDERSDVYSFGVLMYETLTGVLPFNGQSALDIMHKHLHEKPESFATRKVSECPAELERLVLKCLEKQRDLRWSSMEEVAIQLGTLSSTLKLSPKGSRGKQWLPFDTVGHLVSDLSKRPLLFFKRTALTTAVVLAVGIVIAGLNFWRQSAFPSGEHTVVLAAQGVSPEFVQQVKECLSKLPAEVRYLFDMRKTKIELVSNSNISSINNYYDGHGEFVCQIRLGEQQKDFDHAFWTSFGLAVDCQPLGFGVVQYLHDSQDFREAYRLDMAALDDTAKRDASKYVQPKSGLQEAFGESIALVMSPRGEEVNLKFSKHFPHCYAWVKNTFVHVTDWPPLR